MFDSVRVPMRETCRILDGNATPPR